MTPAAVRARLRENRQVINKWLVEDLNFAPGVPTRLVTAMRYAVLGRAKRLRAILALESYRAAGGRQVRVVRPLCSGIEMVQAFSLAHDDLPCMDDDDFRRGKPSLHRRFDEATAVLTGDALLAFAFELFLRCPTTPARRDELLRVMAGALGPTGMAGGQMLDLESQRAVRQLPDQERVNRMKTAVFMAAAVEAGAVLAGISPDQRKQLRAAGLALGMLFQATDDGLDGEAGRGGREERKEVEGSRDQGIKWRKGSRDQGIKGSHLNPRILESSTPLLPLFHQTRRTERLFAVLGTSYQLLASLPEVVLNRKR